MRSLGLSGSLRTAVHDIEARLKDIDNPRLTSWMLMMRRHEKDFMLRRDQKYAGELKKAAAEFMKALAAAGIAPDVTAEITESSTNIRAGSWPGSRRRRKPPTTTPA